MEPFQPGDPKIKLDSKAMSILKAGKPYQVSGWMLLSIYVVSRRSIDTNITDLQLYPSSHSSHVTHTSYKPMQPHRRKSNRAPPEDAAS